MPYDYSIDKIFVIIKVKLTILSELYKEAYDVQFFQKENRAKE